ncbi:hypothetical protein TNCV_2008421 [Trichonephila clavipes]|nr:hypothetical protein TNCV_2008421 [Trichonephila clavipes]
MAGVIAPWAEGLVLLKTLRHVKRMMHVQSVVNQNPPIWRRGSLEEMRELRCHSNQLAGTNDHNDHIRRQ